MKTKVNPLKLIETRFEADNMGTGRYVKRYFFANGLGASVVCHKGSYGGDSGYFEVAVLQYPIGTTAENTCEIIYEQPINDHLGIVDVAGWLDFWEVADILQKIRNFDTGEYSYDK
jgi:hypothetical protein